MAKHDRSNGAWYGARLALLFTLFVLSTIPSAAHAQSFADLLTETRPIVDSRGVDVKTGGLNVTTEPVSIGDLGCASSWSGVTNFTKCYAYVTGKGTAFKMNSRRASVGSREFPQLRRGSQPAVERSLFYFVHASLTTKI